MRLTTLLQRWFAPKRPVRNKRSHQTPMRRSSSFRPQLETLEARDNPSGGLLDTTFGNGGTVTFDSSQIGKIEDTIVQTDGKIVSVGVISVAIKQGHKQELQVIRQNTDGTLDTSFNGTGMVTLLYKNYTEGEVVALQPDGKILIGCCTVDQRSPGIAVVRLNTDGQLDNTFGNTGRKGTGGGIWAFDEYTTSFTERVNDIAVQTDSSNHVTGIFIGTLGSSSPQAIKITSAGQLDSTFGNGGVAELSATDLSGLSYQAEGMTLTPDGNVVVFGVNSSNGLGLIAEFNSSGQLNSNFNGTGYRVDSYNFSSHSETGDRLAIQQTSGGGYRILVATEDYSNSTYHGMIVAYTSDGQLDTSFATNGIFLSTLTGGFDALEIEADGSIIVQGDYLVPDASSIVEHLSADGTIDTSFGPDGTGFIVLWPTRSAACYGLALDPQGNVIFASYQNITRITAP